MVIEHRFDRFRGKGAFGRLRSMLNDPRFAYQEIANRFGVTRQYIAQLANELGINGMQGQRARLSRREPRVIKQFKEYPSDIRGVINKLRRADLRVTPYNSPQPSVPNSVRTSLRVTKNGTRERLTLHNPSATGPQIQAFFFFNDTATTEIYTLSLHDALPI